MKSTSTSSLCPNQDGRRYITHSWGVSASIARKWVWLVVVTYIGLPIESGLIVLVLKEFNSEWVAIVLAFAGGDRSENRQNQRC